MNSLRVLVCCSLVLGLCGASSAAQTLRLSTTTSTADTGLLQVLLPAFEKKYACKVNVIAVGTGKALNLGEAGIVDVVLVHARALEDKFVSEGFGVNRRDVMYNDFVLIGPAADPAGVKKAKTAREAMRRIAARQAFFISRCDESGTYVKEKDLWRAAGVRPAGRWHVEAGMGMGDVIRMATERAAYTLADRGTYNAFYKKGNTNLTILFQGEKGLFNPYGVIAVNPEKYGDVNYALAMKFIDFITGPEGQKIIAGFRVYGEPIFFVYRHAGGKSS